MDIEETKKYLKNEQDERKMKKIIRTEIRKRRVSAK